MPVAASQLQIGGSAPFLPDSTLGSQAPGSGRTLGNLGAVLLGTNRLPLWASVTSSGNRNQHHQPGLLRGVNEMWECEKPPVAWGNSISAIFKNCLFISISQIFMELKGSV